MTYKCGNALWAPRNLGVDRTGLGGGLRPQRRLEHLLAALEGLGGLGPLPELRIALHEMPVEALGDVGDLERPLEQLDSSRRLRGLPVTARLPGGAKEAVPQALPRGQAPGLIGVGPAQSPPGQPLPLGEG